jgi:hypothetical protein
MKQANPAKPSRTLASTADFDPMAAGGSGLAFITPATRGTFLPLCTAERGRLAGGSPVALSDDDRAAGG